MRFVSLLKTTKKPSDIGTGSRRIADSYDMADICDGCGEIFAECDCPEDQEDYCDDLWPMPRGKIVYDD
jgi:hypothetical protein